MCKSCGSKPVHAPSVPLPAVPGEEGFVYLHYAGLDARTVYGPVTGCRYPFWERETLLVDLRDAERLISRNHGEFVEVEGPSR